MKRMIYTILILLLGSGSAWSQKEYLRNIRVLNNEMKKNKADVDVCINLDVSQIKVRRQHSIRLIPVIISKDESKSQELPAIIINGRTRALVHQRVERLTGQPYPYKAQTVIRRYNREKQEINYTASIPFQQWMRGSKLIIREEVSGCTDCMAAGYNQGTTDTIASSCLASPLPIFTLDFKQPKEEIVKTREKSREARLQFRQDSRKILPEYKNNRKELAAIKQSITEIQDDKNVMIKAIYITGYASPEGSREYNLTISKARAEALARYLQDELKIAPEQIHADWKGEDWQGLREEVEKRPKLLHQNKVLAIIDNCTAPDKCEESFKKLDNDGEIYKRLLNECYPPLRKNDYRVQYEVRNFNLGEAKQVIKTNPKLLSLYEIYLVAQAYGNDPVLQEQIIHTAAEAYPENGIAASNAARLDLQKGNIRAAINRLEKAKADPDTWGALGVVYARDEQWELAKQYLVKAATQGDNEARENLQKLETYIQEP